MLDTNGPRGEVIQMRAGQRNARRDFLLLDRMLVTLVPRGSKKCRKAMRKLDAAFGMNGPETVPASVIEQDDETRVLLRARCRLCAKRCRDPLA